MPSLQDGMHGKVIVVPKLGAQRCGNCKFQQQLPEWGDQKLCLESPAGVTAVWQFMPTPQGLQGGVTKDAHFPPAPDHWWCGRWKPRFSNESGDQIK